jgi:hypothetical protein
VMPLGSSLRTRSSKSLSRVDCSGGRLSGAGGQARQRQLELETERWQEVPGHWTQLMWSEYEYEAGEQTRRSVEITWARMRAALLCESTPARASKPRGLICHYT